MQQTGFLLPLAVVANGQTTGNPWTNPNNILLIDGQTADSNGNPASPSDITIGNFAFNIPIGSIITGIEYHFIGYRGAQTSPVITLTPYAEDDTSTVPQFYPGPAFTGFTQSMATYTLGSSSYLFATTWTADQINNLKMNLVALGAVYMDGVLVNVHFIPPAAPTPSPLTSTCVNEIEALPTELAVPLEATAISAIVKSFNYPAPDNTVPTPITMVEAGPYIDIILSKGLGNQENARVGNIIPLPNGFVQLDFYGGLAGRGLGNKPPYTSDPLLIRSHTSNASLTITNTAPFYQRFLKFCHIDTYVSAPIAVLDESALVTSHVHQFNFMGNGVTVQVPNPLLPDNLNIIIPGNGNTPPSPVSTSSTTSGNVQVTSLTWMHTSSGINRVLLVQVSTEELTTITGITYDGNPLTQAVSATDAPNNIRSEIWYLIAPPVGTYNIVVSLSPAAYISAGAESYVNADQSSPIGATQTATGSSITPSLVLVTTSDYSLVVDGLSTATTPMVYVAGPGQTTNWSRTANTDTRQGGSSLEPSGITPDSVTMDYTLSQTAPWVITAVELKGIQATLSPISTYDEGILVDGNTIQFNFTGSGVTATQTSPGIVEVNVPGAGGQASIQFMDEGVNLGTPGTVDEFDVTGSGASLTRVGNKVTLNVPGGSGGGVFQQFINLFSAVQNAATPGAGVGTASTDGTVIWIWVNSSINRYDQDTVTGAYYLTASGGVGACGGMAVIGNDLYISYRVGNVRHIDKYDATTIAFVSAMSGVGLTNAIVNCIMYTDGTDLYMYKDNTPTWNHYTISGTVLTLAGTIATTFDPQAAVYDGTDVLTVHNDTFYNINPTTGAVNNSYSRNYRTTSTTFGIVSGNNPSVLVPVAAGMMYVGQGVYNAKGATSSPGLAYLVLDLLPVERP